MPQHGQTTTPPTRLPPSATGTFGSSGTAGSATPELSSLPGSCRAPGGLAGIRVGGVRGSARIPGHPEQTEAHTTLPLPVNVTITLLRLSGSVSSLMSPFVANRLSRFATAPEVTIVLLSSAPTVSRSMTSPANLKPDDPTRRDTTIHPTLNLLTLTDDPTRRDATSAPRFCHPAHHRRSNTQGRDAVGGHAEYRGYRRSNTQGRDGAPLDRFAVNFCSDRVPRR